MARKPSFTIAVAEVVRSDLDGIYEYIAERNPAAALRLSKQLDRAIRNLNSMPGRFAVRANLGNELRTRVVGPYLIVFRIARSQVEIIRVLHGARDLHNLLPGTEASDNREPDA